MTGLLMCRIVGCARWLTLGGVLVLATCAAPRNAQVRLAEPPNEAADERAEDVVWEEYGAADDRTPATPDASHRRLLLFDRDAWAARTVCELRLGDGPQPAVEWRELPVETFNGIRSGEVPDALHAYVDGKGIVDCGQPGCWVPLRADARGCGLVCDSQKYVCALAPVGEGKP